MTDDRDSEEVNKKLDLMLQRLETLEKTISMVMGSPEIISALGLMRFSGELYQDFAHVSSRISKAQRHLANKEVSFDELMRCIIRTIAVRGPRNISQITRDVQRTRGKASRRTVAAKLHRLEEMGAVKVVQEKAKQKTYELT
jgi:DNA-binding transcriptional ArsR family regulator